MDILNILEKEFPIYFLNCKESFVNLSEKEKKYIFSLIKAGWNGALIDLIQCSPESPGIFYISQKIFKNENFKEIENLILSLSFDIIDKNDFLNYFTTFYDNLGNYRSFGDSKFIPRIDQNKFEKIISETKAFKNEVKVREVFNIIKNDIYSLNERNKQMGLGKDGISTYYSFNIDEEDAKYVQSFLDKHNISAYNTRVFKTINNNKTSFEVRQASSERGVYKELMSSDNTELYIVNGDYSELMTLMVSELQISKQLALNSTESEMIKSFIESFTTGSIEAHKAASRLWIKDKCPVVENYIGFIESYRDPIGVRGEFEAFIAVVNKPMTEKFDKLVNNAPQILSLLPWSNEYEKDKFLQPDFTSLDIINFPNSGIPVGINIPNYDDIRQSEGFKNVSLGNVLKARFQDPKATFLRECDKTVFIKRAEEAFEIQVGLHELIGHGSGKLFRLENETFNFNQLTTADILTNGPITSWYKGNETWDSIFMSIASPFEECRAECVGIYLCSDASVLNIFGHSELNDKMDVVYVNWLSMVKSGLVSMEFYTTNQKKWRQAHCQARFVILQVLLEAGNGFLKIEEITDSDGKPDLEIHLDRTKIESIGRKAISDFLKRLQYYKSTANVSEGSTYFSRYSNLNDHFLHLREIVIERKSPRAAMVQSVVTEQSGKVELIEYPNTAEGMIQSFKDRFAGEYGEKALDALYNIWCRDQIHFQQ